jgi:DNA-binding response OmpR family regulator
MYKILLIEDNEFIIKGIVYLLKQHNFDVDVVSTLNDAKKHLENNYNLIILDLMLPDGDGIDFFKKTLTNKPTLVLTAKDDEDVISDALDNGVEDYMVKPFKAKELLSRINKIIRKNKDNNLIKVKNVVIDTDAARVYVDNVEVIFTSLEYRILLLLFQNLNRIVTREIIMEQIWDISGNFVEDNTLTVYIKRIREKLGSDIIKTIKGLGYRVDV